MRLDKFLKASRVIKRRSAANTAADMGRITVNGKEAKPAKQIKEGDIVSIKFGERQFTFKITYIKDAVKKDDPLMYEVIEG